MSYLSFDFNGDIDDSAIRKALQEDGVLVVKNAIASSDVDLLRKIVLNHLNQFGERLMLGKTQPNAAVAVKDMEFLFANKNIIDIYKRILGPNAVVFTGHSDIHKNLISGWHKDSGESVGGYFEGDYIAADDCTVYKVATYLQNTNVGDGLTVRIGSHRSKSLTEGKEVKLNLDRGDIVIFDVRISHVGRIPNTVERLLKNCSRLANFGNRNRQDPRLVSWIAEKLARLVGRKDRMSVFFTFGPPNKFTFDFSQNNMKRQNEQSKGFESVIPAKLKDAFALQGVTTYSPGIET